VKTGSRPGFTIEAGWIAVQVDQLIFQGIPDIHQLEAGRYLVIV